MPKGFLFERAFPEQTYAWMDDLSWNPEGSRLSVLFVGKYVILGPAGPEFRLEQDLAAMNNLAWSPDGRLLAAGTAAGIYVWRTDVWELLGKLLTESAWNTEHISWSNSQNLLACAQGDHIDLWKLDIDRFGNPTQVNG